MPTLVTLRQAVQLLNVSQDTIHQWVRRNLLQAVETAAGGPSFYLHDVEKLLEEQQARIQDWTTKKRSATMLNPLKLKLEIALILDAMRNASDTRRDFLIGQLSALLWVRSDGEMSHALAFQMACEAWDKQQTTNTTTPSPSNSTAQD